MAYQALAQIVPVAAAPVITRLYTSAQYGALGLFGTVVALGMALSTGRYQRATLLADDDADAINTTRLALLCALVFSTFVFVIELSTYPLWRSTSFAHALSFWVYFIPLSIFLTASFDCFVHYGLRANLLPAINAASIRRAFVNVGATIGLGAAGWGTSGTIAGTVLSQGASMGSLSLHFMGKAQRVPRRWFRLRELAVRHRKFPKYDVWANLAMIATYIVMPIGIASLYSTAMVGLYTLAYRLLALPADFIGTSMGELYFRSLSTARYDPHAVRQSFRRTLRITSLCAVPCVVGAPLAPWLFSRVFGASWEPAGYLAVAMAPHVAARLASTPLYSTFAMFERQQELLVGQAALLVATIATFAVGGAIGLAVVPLLWVHSATMVLIYVLLLARAWRIAAGHGGPCVASLTT